MADLSPQAQAVLDAYWTFADSLDRDASDEEVLAAALRAAADQVVPDDSQEAMHFTTEAIRLNRQGVRRHLLAIAAELETLDG